jgi:hypothetical protein
MLMIKTPRRNAANRGVCFLLAVFALNSAVAAAQCSQSARPVASSEPSSAVSAVSSSSSETADTVRFATGNAITVLEDTKLQVINDMPISSRTTKDGARIAFTVTQDVVVDGVLVIPCGATVYGTVVSLKQAGRLTGSSNLTLQLSALNLNGRSYPLYTPPFKVVGQSKTRPTVDKMATGAAVGALATKATVPTNLSYNQLSAGGPEKTVHYTISPADQAKGIALAAGVGAGVGAAIAASSPPSIALIPAESEMEFTLASPIAVYPVDQRTAARLAQGMHPGGPVLYVRGETQ